MQLGVERGQSRDLWSIFSATGVEDLIRVGTISNAVARLHAMTLQPPLSPRPEHSLRQGLLLSIFCVNSQPSLDIRSQETMAQWGGRGSPPGRAVRGTASQECSPQWQQPSSQTLTLWEMSCCTTKTLLKVAKEIQTGQMTAQWRGKESWWVITKGQAGRAQAVAMGTHSVHCHHQVLAPYLAAPSAATTPALHEPISILPAD